MSRAPAISARSLTQVYDRRTVLDIPSLDVPPGEILAVLGPNGSGKTTLLSILSLLAAPASGHLEIFGKNADSESHRNALRRNVTLIHQKPVLFSTTVSRNVCYGLRSLGLPAK